MENNDYSQTISIKPGEAQIWLFNLEHPSPPPQDWEQVLSAEEIARSKRFMADRDRMLFVARHGILRHLLSQYCGLDPANIRYRVNPYGKLFLESYPLTFNLSKSADRVAYVFTLEKDAGVDIEQVRPLPDLSRVAKHFFSREEQADLAALPPSLRVEAFYHTWTQKEAFIKAQGLGLTQALEDFSVSVDPTKPGKLLSIKGCVDEPTDWKMACFNLQAGWHVSLCVRSNYEVEINVRMAEESNLCQLSLFEKRHTLYN